MSQLSLDGVEETVADPNEDLVGYQFNSDHGVLRVVRTAPWAAKNDYVLCESLDGKFLTARATQLVRLHRGL